MDNNFDKNTLEKAKRLASSDAAQQLSQKLQQMDPAIMQQLQAQISSGNYSQISNTLAPLLASADIQKLLRQLGG